MAVQEQRGGDVTGRLIDRAWSWQGWEKPPLPKGESPSMVIWEPSEILQQKSHTRSGRWKNHSGSRERARRKGKRQQEGGRKG